jgi:hypothetical protein
MALNNGLDTSFDKEDGVKAEAARKFIREMTKLPSEFSSAALAIRKYRPISALIRQHATHQHIYP